jgi:hypothetical protein
MRVNGGNFFIGALVTIKIDPNIDLVGEGESVEGIIIGPSHMGNIPSEGYYTNDFDNPFSDNCFVNVGLLQEGQVVLVCSGTNCTIYSGDPLKVVDGCVEIAEEGDLVQFIAEEIIIGISNTRSYLRVRYYGNYRMPKREASIEISTYKDKIRKEIGYIYKTDLTRNYMEQLPPPKKVEYRTLRIYNLNGEWKEVLYNDDNGKPL